MTGFFLRLDGLPAATLLRLVVLRPFCRPLSGNPRQVDAAMAGGQKTESVPCPLLPLLLALCSGSSGHFLSKPGSTASEEHGSL